MRQLFAVNWAVTLAALLVLPVAATAQTVKPFQGKGTVEVKSVLVGDCFDDAEYSISGQGKPLGMFIGVGEQRVSYCGAPDIEGQVTLTAENGDQLVLDYIGTRVSPTRFRCDVSVAGGTGRYQGATVDAVLIVEDYSPSGPFRLNFRGTITFP